MEDENTIIERQKEGKQETDNLGTLCLFIEYHTMHSKPNSTRNYQKILQSSKLMQLYH